MALMLGSGGNEKIKTIWNILYDKFSTLQSVEKAYGLFLSDLLKIISLEKDKFKNISDKLEGFANKFNKDKNFHLSRSHYERAIDWVKLLKNQDEICRLKVQIAESFVSEATVRTQGDKPSYLAAGKFLEDAIHTYRKIPNDKRQTYNVEERF